MGQRVRYVIPIILLLSLVACSVVHEDTPRDDLTGEDPDDRLNLTKRCENSRGGYALHYPEGWHVNEASEGIPGCRVFDPRPIQLEANTEIPLDVGMIVSTTTTATPQELAEVPDPSVDVHRVQSFTLGGFEAIFMEKTGTGMGLIPENTRMVSYFVDLDGRTLVASSSDLGEPSFERKRSVLKTILSTLEPIGDRN